MGDETTKDISTLVKDCKLRPLLVECPVHGPVPLEACRACPEFAAGVGSAILCLHVSSLVMV
jgi:hypothetical protein